MYTFAFIMCALIAVFGALAIVMEVVLNKYVFEPVEEDLNDAWYEAE